MSYPSLATPSLSSSLDRVSYQKWNQGGENRYEGREVRGTGGSLLTLAESLGGKPAKSLTSAPSKGAEILHYVHRNRASDQPPASVGEWH